AWRTANRPRGLHRRGIDNDGRHVRLSSAGDGDYIAGNRVGREITGTNLPVETRGNTIRVSRKISGPRLINVRVRTDGELPRLVRNARSADGNRGLPEWRGAVGDLAARRCAKGSDRKRRSAAHCDRRSGNSSCVAALLDVLTQTIGDRSRIGIITIA